LVKERQASAGGSARFGTHGDKRQDGQGAFVFTLDTEMAWGSIHHASYAGHEKEFDRTRHVIDRLVELFDTYGISGTWAIVGHLLIGSCAEVGGVKHPEIVRPNYDWFPHDWLHRDPCGSVATDPWWYGPDIVEKIRSCKTPQEIGCHNFSHMIVGDPGCSREAFTSELNASIAAARAHGIKMSSFVYPRNAVGHVDALIEHGFTSYRSLGGAWFDRLPGPFVRMARLVDDFMPIGTPVSRPEYRDGIWEFKASYRYLHRNGWARYVPVQVRVRKAVASLRRAAREGSVFHMWTHPFNIASDTEGLLGGLERIFQEVKALRDSGLLASRTMSEMVESLAVTAEPKKQMAGARGIPERQVAHGG
jgi:peptidoglycan/xylan/chitin deacetylase (PgdA/CDA1 family)